jgi:hypothetical protein
MQDTVASKKNYGMATLANDKIIRWLLPFLESYLATNASTPLYVIPYDDNVLLTRRATEIYGVNFVETNSAELDALAKRLYPLFPAHRRRLRKLLCLALPLDEVIYFDADIILFRDFGSMFGRLEAGKTELIVSAQANDFVYNKNSERFDFLCEAIRFNDGFFVAANSILSLKNFRDVIEKDEAVFHVVRQRGMLFAQPLTNFVVHRLGMRVSPLYNCIPGASGESFYKAEGVTFDAAGPRDSQGYEIYFAHWAGAVALPNRRVFDAAWRQYADLAAARMKY